MDSIDYLPNVCWFEKVLFKKWQMKRLESSQQTSLIRRLLRPTDS